MKNNSKNKGLKMDSNEEYKNELLKEVKAEMLKLYNKFKDTEHKEFVGPILKRIVDLIVIIKGVKNEDERVDKAVTGS